MNIGFTGHRNRTATIENLRSLAQEYPGATWIHGGAKGFDTQVADFAAQSGIKAIVIRPDYATHGRGAPFVRNKAIVEQSDLVVACWDGREHGGTWHAIGIARKLGKSIRFAGIEK